MKGDNLEKRSTGTGDVKEVLYYLFNSSFPCRPINGFTLLNTKLKYFKIRGEPQHWVTGDFCPGLPLFKNRLLHLNTQRWKTHHSALSYLPLPVLFLSSFQYSLSLFPFFPKPTTVKWVRSQRAIYEHNT